LQPEPFKILPNLSQFNPEFVENSTVLNDRLEEEKEETN
jgi:hypothetical protein